MPEIRYDMPANPLETSAFTGSGETPLDFKTIAKDVPCQHACPAGTDVPAYLRAIASGDMDEAYRINQEHNVFPGILGRICTRPCEPACRHQWTNTRGPVTICHLKRSCADGKGHKPEPRPPWFEETAKRVVIVGGGPAGLTAARELKRYGHSVAVYDREEVLGGVMSLGIPSFRLPREVVNEEIAAIVGSGVEVHLNAHIDDTLIHDLRESSDALIVAAGAIHSIKIELEGLEEGAARGGYDFIKDYNLGRVKELDGAVLVIGGGFTAVDCVRAARRLLGPGRGSAVMMYRRTEAQMSASPEEIAEMRAEGCEIETLVTPVRARMQEGRLQAVTFVRNILAPGAQQDSKPEITPIAGSDFDVPCNHLIMAVGQGRGLEILPEGAEFTDDHHTTREGLFCTGDFHYGTRDVIHAVADGKQVADEVDLYLMGRIRKSRRVEISLQDDPGRLRDHDLTPPHHMPVLPIAQRLGNEEIEIGYSDDATKLNAWRCYLCNHKYEIDQDKCIHCDWCIKVSPRQCILKLADLEMDGDGFPIRWTETDESDKAKFIWINSDECIRCGNCLRICPTDAISLRKLTLVDKLEHTGCSSCGPDPGQAGNRR